MDGSVFITWILMRISRIECTFVEVKKRQYQADNEVTLISEQIKITEDKIAFLKDKNHEIKNRRDTVDAKARTLLTLNSLLLGLVFSTSSLASAKSVGILAIIPIILLFLTIFLLTVYFGINTYQTVDYSYIFSNLEPATAQRMLCNDILRSQDYNERTTNFIVDLYRSALRYFSVAMVCIMTLGIENIVTPNLSPIIKLFTSITNLQ